MCMTTTECSEFPCHVWLGKLCVHTQTLTLEDQKICTYNKPLDTDACKNTDICVDTRYSLRTNEWSVQKMVININTRFVHYIQSQIQKSHAKFTGPSRPLSFSSSCLLRFWILEKHSAHHFLLFHPLKFLSKSVESNFTLSSQRTCNWTSCANGTLWKQQQQQTKSVSDEGVDLRWHDLLLIALAPWPPNDLVFLQGAVCLARTLPCDLDTGRFFLDEVDVQVARRCGHWNTSIYTVSQRNPTYFKSRVFRWTGSFTAPVAASLKQAIYLKLSS